MDQKLEETIIHLAQQQHSRADIIRTLVMEGYEPARIEEVINTLYYSGKLSFDLDSVIERENIHTIDTAVEKQQEEAPSLSFRLRVWIRLHTVSAISIGTLGVIVITSIVGGVWGYRTSPTVILDHALASLAATPTIAYTLSGTIQPSTQESFTFSSEGIIAIAPSPRAVASLTFQRNTDPQWNIDIIHTSEDAIFLKLNKGPLPYPFIYNRWIQVGSSQADITSLTQLGLHDIISHVGIARPFLSDFSSVMRSFSSTPGAYTKISQVSSTTQPSCASLYAVSFDERRIAQSLSTLAGSDIRALAFLTQFPWQVCLNSEDIITKFTIHVPKGSGAGEGTLLITLASPQTLPAFTTDTPATPLATLMEWVREGKQK